MIDVALIIKDCIVQRGLQSILGQIPAVRSTTVLDSPEDAGDAGVVILSAAEPGWSDHVRALTRCRPVKVLVLLSGGDMLEQAQQASADGFLTQHEVTVESLGRALEQLDSGDIPMPAELARMLLRQASSPGPPAARAQLLTPREKETLQLLVDGLSNKQMGRRLGISEHGAKRLVSNVLTKLDSPNRTSAVAVALQYGILHD